jgi:predicted RNA binding protein YcfA (HicA-like mRNA interferase family)
VRLRELKYEELVARLRKLGFRFYRQGKGSHELWVRDSDGKVVPFLDMVSLSGKGTLRAIIREISISVDEFMKLR